MADFGGVLAAGGFHAAGYIYAPGTGGGDGGGDVVGGQAAGEEEGAAGGGSVLVGIVPAGIVPVGIILDGGEAGGDLPVEGLAGAAVEAGYLAVQGDDTPGGGVVVNALGDGGYGVIVGVVGDVQDFDDGGVGLYLAAVGDGFVAAELYGVKVGGGDGWLGHRAGAGLRKGRRTGARRGRRREGRR